MHISGCMGSISCMKFWTHTPHNMHFTALYLCVWVMISLKCDAVSLSQTLPRYDTREVIKRTMGLLPDTHNCGLCMRRECRELFPRHKLQRKSLVSDPSMHHGTCVTHVSWCMSGSLTHSGGENVPSIPGACATRNFAYLVRGPLTMSPL